MIFFSLLSLIHLKYCLFLSYSDFLIILDRYSPILPIVSLRTPSYTQTVESVRSIASTAAYVESQSLILAYGGPDIFFTRLAPSKGFDLLPDDFNRSLLALVVIGLLIVMNTVKKMGNKKMVKMGWT
uniref:ER membrane protein complex subunit 1 n=1 Tax=Ditylum brightwellii TaxID=49249 RepID=A0A7S4QGC1_9STRA|mmetsp:Transcript_35210/g.53291  ORF Transcript_35210/g.53291 Transcript_35210/m.53291 type:complete len:127 (+) Transcript_35210:116-496(+)